ncbi:NUDIX domain-containing protein [Pseudooceanicola aestuarii]|uniref:NUDIX domain-containing protein n=1 Tax=Pseudooceanicola aestuarii TaxID=2697319 RepID=UPI001EF8FDB1|nr:NUDIX domain-containing protein [Pseudooceanicola aestuarii]
MTTSLFVFGTLRDPDLLRMVAGADLAVEPATLPGWRAMRAAAGAWPVLVNTPGHGAPGLLLRDPGARALDRLHHYEDAFGYVAREEVVETATGPVPALVYRTQGPPDASDEVWALEIWQARSRADTLEAVPEVMSHHGRFAGTDLQGRMPQVLARAASRMRAQRDAPPRQMGTDLHRRDVTSLAVDAAHQGYFRTEVHDLRHPTFAGALSDPIRREIFVAADAAIVLPYDPLRDRVLLVEQFRMGPYGRGAPHPWVLEPVAGRVDVGETPAAAARRECAEEAGLSLHRLEEIGSFYPSPGFLTEYFYLYLGLCDLPDGHTGPGGLDNEGEDIRTHILSFEAAMDLLSRGEADNGPLILSLLWLARERSRLRAGLARGAA